MTDVELTVVLVGSIAGFLLVRYLLRDKEPAGAVESYTQQRDDAPEDSWSASGNARSERPSSEQEGNTSQFRIFSCPVCGQRIRVRVPLPGNVTRCGGCDARLVISVDPGGHLSVEAEQSAPSSPPPKTVEECFAILGLGPVATSEEIKRAYRQRMKEYHPDKVANLGEKPRSLAAIEAQRLNVAYGMLKDRGFLNDV